MNYRFTIASLSDIVSNYMRHWQQIAMPMLINKFIIEIGSVSNNDSHRVFIEKTSSTFNSLIAINNCWFCMHKKRLLDQGQECTCLSKF